VYNGQPDPFQRQRDCNCAPTLRCCPTAKPIAVLCKQYSRQLQTLTATLGFSAALQSGVPNRQTTWDLQPNTASVLTENGPRTDVSDITT